eukprot:11265176-Prorocentrum_lima.AAC.1
MRRALGAFDDFGEVRLWVRVVPMGWNWAVHLIQQTHRHIIETALSIPMWVLDKRPAAVIHPGEAGVVLYIDNFAAIAPDPDNAKSIVKDIQSTLSDKGIVSHLEASPGDFDCPTLLGF